MQDVEVGHPDFDRDFVIKGTDGTKLRQIFGNARIRELITAQPKIHFEVKDAKVVESIYNQVYDKYSPEMPPDLIQDLFESRTTPELGWPQGKPLPDLNQFVDRSIVNEVLKEMGRKPGGK